MGQIQGQDLGLRSQVSTIPIHFRKGIWGGNVIYFITKTNMYAITLIRCYFNTFKPISENSSFQ